MPAAAAARTEKAARQRVSPFTLTLGMTAAVASAGLIPWVRANGRLAGSVWGAAAALLALLLVVRHRVRSSGRVPRYEFAPKRVHYVQMAMHTSIYLYWGWYWREVYPYVPLLLAQVAFVYALDMLVCWWRRDTWILGFGPFPIVFSANLFLWFRDDWFYLQFLMMATAVLCKEFVTWKRDGRRTHIFNPSAIALAIFSVGLLVTGSTQTSWGEAVSVSLGRPPYMYLWIFATGLVVQSLFAVTLVTLSAAAALVVLNLAYTAFTGVYYFVDATIPIAVFLGLHLLVTDPATSPRRNIGKAIFGAMYGTAVFTLYAVLGWLGMPTFYDKLLCVPPMNLTARWLDRASSAIEERLRDRFAGWDARRLNYAHMALWIALFAGMTSGGLLGSGHPGTHSEFWRRACEEGRREGCRTWVRMSNVACVHGAGAACNQLALAQDAGLAIPRDAGEAGRNFARACDAKIPGACFSLVSLVKKDGEGVFGGPCDRGDGESCFVLASLQYAAGAYGPSAALFRRSCEGGWPRGCGGLAELYRAGKGVAADAARANGYFERACRAGIAASCFALGRRQQACDLSLRAVTDNEAYFRAGIQPADPGFCEAR